MLSGLIYPTSGTARVAGFDPAEAGKRLSPACSRSCSAEKPTVVGSSRPESFNLLRAIYAIPRDQFKARWTSGDLLDVGKKLNVMVRELSLGERMKMELIAALLHQPTSAVSRRADDWAGCRFAESGAQFLRDYNSKHETTILLTSHYMADIKELCKRVIVIHNGEKVYDGALDRLESSGGSRKKIITFVPALASEPTGRRVSRTGNRVTPAHTTRADDGKFTLRVPGDQVVAVSQEILSTGPVADITIEDVRLEDVIAELFSAQA